MAGGLVLKLIGRFSIRWLFGRLIDQLVAILADWRISSLSLMVGCYTDGPIGSGGWPTRRSLDRWLAKRLIRAILTRRWEGGWLFRHVQSGIHMRALKKYAERHVDVAQAPEITHPDFRVNRNLATSYCI